MQVDRAIGVGVGEAVFHIAADGAAHPGKLHPYLVGAAGLGPHLEQTASVGIPFQDLEVGMSRKSVRIDQASSKSDCVPADRCIAGKFILSGVSNDPGQISFLHFASFELRLHDGRNLSRSAEDQDSRRVGIQPVLQQSEFNFEGGPYPMAAAFRGNFPSAFEAGLTGTDSRIVVVGDGDFVNETMVGQVPNNIEFVLNMVDWLIQDDALLEIRAKSIAPRRLGDVPDAWKPVVKYANLLGPVLIVMLFGVVRWRRRKNRTVDPG